MSINGIFSSGNFGIIQSAQGQLSEETKQKLQALGIDPSTVTSETQAQALIAAAQQKIQQTNNDSSSKNTCCTSECELIARAKNLASKIGVQTSSNDSLTSLIDKITSKLTSLETQTAVDDKNKSEIQKYKSELTTIKNEYAEVNTNQNSLITAMTLTANLNKFLLGIH